MPHRTTIRVALTALLLAAAAAHHRRLQRALHAERATRRITDASHHRDLTAFQHRLTAVTRDRELLAAADHILDTALAAHRDTDDPHTEGGPA